MALSSNLSLGRSSKLKVLRIWRACGLIRICSISVRHIRLMAIPVLSVFTFFHFSHQRIASTERLQGTQSFQPLTVNAFSFDLFVNCSNESSIWYCSDFLIPSMKYFACHTKQLPVERVPCKTSIP